MNVLAIIKDKGEMCHPIPQNVASIIEKLNFLKRLKITETCLLFLKNVLAISKDKGGMYHPIHLVSIVENLNFLKRLTIRHPIHLASIVEELNFLKKD